MEESGFSVSGCERRRTSQPTAHEKPTPDSTWAGSFYKQKLDRFEYSSPSPSKEPDNAHAEQDESGGFRDAKDIHGIAEL